LKYDLQENFFRQRAIGLEFDCECMKAGISYSATMASASAQTDHRVMFSFNLATLGGSSAAARF